MELKWKILICALLAMLVAGVYLVFFVEAASAAILFPLPIDGIVTGGGSNNALISITNLRTGISEDAYTTPDGEYLYDWANSVEPVQGSKYENGDRFRIEVVFCVPNPQCAKEVIYTGQNELFVSFDLAGTVTSTVTETEIVTTTTTTVGPETPADYTSEIIVGALALLFASTGGVMLLKKYFITFVKNGWGVRIYKSQDGTKIEVTHKHPGIRNYHSPDTTHANIATRHAKGKIF